MDRAEWLACDDPERILGYLMTFAEIGLPRAPKRGQVSDRKLRLFAEACDRLGFCQLHQVTASHMVRCVNDAPNRQHRPAVAVLLREVVGDPFSPVAISRTDRSLDAWWSDSTVLAVARAAYDERAERWECKRCQQPVSPWFSHGHKRMWFACSNCRVSLPTDEGARCVGDGTLDPVRLLVLADALEEAGAGYTYDEQTLLWHLRGLEVCPECRGLKAMTLEKWAEVGEPESTACRRCEGNGLVVLRGPHVKGCWALDLILGKS